MKKLHLQEISKTDVAVFVLLAICSGLMIGIGATASLLAQNLFNDWGKIIGAVLFSLGIYAIVTFEMKLFTGMVADIPKMPKKNFWTLPVCFIGNAIGVACMTLLVTFTPISDMLVAQATSIVEGKFNVEYWYLSAFSSSTLCGVLITISIWSANHSPRNGLSATLGVILPIVIFAFCGFDHCIANLFYFDLYAEFSWRIIGYNTIAIVGNLFGGVVLPLAMIWREKTRAQEKQENN